MSTFFIKYIKMMKDQKCHGLNPVSQFFSYNIQLLINERTAI